MHPEIAGRPLESTGVGAQLVNSESPVAADGSPEVPGEW